jgi:hypothetical protein
LWGFPNNQIGLVIDDMKVGGARKAQWDCAENRGVKT